MATHESTPSTTDPVESSPTVTCPECDGQVRSTTTETRCTDCGLILDDTPVDRGPQWWGDDDRKRTGPQRTPARHDHGLSTEIGRHRDGAGHTLSGAKRRQLSRLRRYHNRARFESKRERNLAHACHEIARIVSALDLPTSVRHAASLLFREAQAENLVRGRSIETIAAGSVYGACREAGVVRSIESIAGVATGDRGKVLLGYRVLNRELSLATPPLTAGDVLPRISDDIDAGHDIERRAIELAIDAHDQGVGNGCAPSGLAAACLYRASREHGDELTQATVADAADVSVPTVRARWQELRDVVV